MASWLAPFSANSREPAERSVPSAVPDGTAMGKTGRPGSYFSQKLREVLPVAATVTTR